MKVTKKMRKDYLKLKLSTDYKWASKALLKIYEYQTYEERYNGKSLVRNNVGFSLYDSKFLMSIAERVRNNKYLTKTQTINLHVLIQKYWKQILEISDVNKLDSMIVKETGQLSFKF